MDTATAQATLTDANTRMSAIAQQMENLRAQQLQLLRNAQAIADESAVKDAIATIGLIRGSFLRVPEGAAVISALTLGKFRHTKEIAFPLIDGSTAWLESRPSSEAWIIGSAPLVTAKELFNLPTRTTFLGI